MSTEYFQKIAETNIWGAIAPELALGVLALALLAMEVILPKVAHGLIPRVAILGQLVILGVMLTYGRSGLCYTGEAFGGMLSFSETGQLFRAFFLGTSIFVSYLGMVSLEKKSKRG